MTNKHTSKASGISDSLISTPNGVHGVFFNVEGDVATANQFFVTDSTKHFLRVRFILMPHPTRILCNRSIHFWLQI